MKKVLAILLAALMMFTTFGMFSYAADVSEDTFTLQDAIALAEGMKDVGGNKPVVLVFDTASAKLGTVFQGNEYYINSGALSGCWALVSPTFVPERSVQLPNIKDAGDEMAANWLLETAVEEQGRTYASGSLIKITQQMVDKEYIVFRAQLVANEQTPVIAKILNIFYKIVKVLFGEQLAIKFQELCLEFGVVIEK